MRRTVLIFVVLIVLALIGGAAYWYLHKQAQTSASAPVIEEDTSAYFTPSMLPQAPIEEPAGDRIGIQSSAGITYTNNFYKTAVMKTDEALVLATNDRYDIVYYFRDGSSFLITINSLPIQENRLAAEADLLSILGITKKDACRLDVNTGVPGSTDPALAGTSYGLSFCP